MACSRWFTVINNCDMALKSAGRSVAIAPVLDATYKADVLEARSLMYGYADAV